MRSKIKDLEEKMVTYKDLVAVKVTENNESFAEIPISINSKYMQPFSDMSSYFDGKMFLRKTVIKKILQAQKSLEQINNQITFCVTYGYRSLEIQTNRFQTILKGIDGFFSSPIDLYEEAHRFVAVPTVAGHPTGGAIDIILIDKKTGKSLDFGSKQYDYSSKACYVSWPNISQEAKENRLLLRKCLLEVGFAPFDGEWWHFSYGDREWAYYYKKDYAIYNQVNSKDISKFMIK